MLKILQAGLQQHIKREFPDVQGGFRKGRGTRDQIAKIRLFTEKAKEFQKKKTSTSASSAKCKSLIMWIITNWKILENMRILKEMNLPPESHLCMSGSNCCNQTWNNELVQNW